MEEGPTLRALGRAAALSWSVRIARPAEAGGGRSV